MHMAQREHDDSDETTVDDPILDAFLSDSRYDRIRVERFSHFKQPIPRKLAVQCALLGSLVLLVPLYALYPQSTAEYLPTLDPVVASPKVLFLGAFGVAVELATATLLVAAALYRVRNDPLSEEQAATVFDVENFATYLGFGTGGVTIALTLGFFLLGVGGESALGWYVTTMEGANPFAATGTSFSVGHLATVALSGALAVLVARAYVASELAALDG
ncbi:MAG: hypothetical protein ABEJ40_07080 [Haloarculaceae archaeon]